MNEALQCLLKRRSTKKYQEKQVPDELLDQVLEAGLYAPTGRNNQNVICVAVRDQKIRVHLLHETQPVTLGACSHRIVERKHSR